MLIRGVETSLKTMGQSDDEMVLRQTTLILDSTCFWTLQTPKVCLGAVHSGKRCLNLIIIYCLEHDAICMRDRRFNTIKTSENIHQPYLKEPIKVFVMTDPILCACQCHVCHKLPVCPYRNLLILCRFC